MPVEYRGLLRTTYDLAAFAAIATGHVTRVTVRTLAAVPGDIWSSKCLKNAHRCHHGVPQDDRLDPEVVPPPCCDAVAEIDKQLATV